MSSTVASGCGVTDSTKVAVVWTLFAEHAFNAESLSDALETGRGDDVNRFDGTVIQVPLPVEENESR